MSPATSQNSPTAMSASPATYFKRGRAASFRLLSILALFASQNGASAQNPDSSPQKNSRYPSNQTALERQDNPGSLHEKTPFGWNSGFIGAFRGSLDLSFGVKLSPDHTQFRNLILGGSLDLAPSLRARAVIRRREGDRKAFQIDPDELYLEAFNEYRAQSWTASASLKFGNIRSLRTPYPDAISLFDRIPGVSDLSGGPPNDYRNAVLSAELACANGFGLHFSGQARGIDEPIEGRVLEAYGFFRRDFGDGWRFEGRLGAIPKREGAALTSLQPGGDLYIGKRVGEFQVGVFYENKVREREFGGLMLQFRPGAITKAIGKYALDYSRPPDGITAQIPVFHLRVNESRTVRKDDILVGEVRAIRVRRVGDQGFVRDEYEHRLESWGETGSRRLRCVVAEEPWVLEAETFLFPQRDQANAFEKSRLGGERLIQKVTYRYYRKYRRNDPNGI